MSDVSIDDLQVIDLSGATTALSFDGAGYDAMRVFDATPISGPGESLLFLGGLSFGNVIETGAARLSTIGDWERIGSSSVLSRTDAPDFASFRLSPVSVFRDVGQYGLW